MKRIHGRTAILSIVLVVAALNLSEAASWASEVQGEAAATLAVRYAEAFASGNVDEWAGRDLGCLTRQREEKQGGTQPQELTRRHCWEDTMKVHRTLVEDDPETGILGQGGPGQGFGLLAPRHRTAAKWKTYPPGVFLSPAVVHPTPETIPIVTVKNVFPTEPVALNQSGGEMVTVPGTMVELSVQYPDPLSAPLALAPNEVWWARGTARRYQPIQSVLVRFVVVGDLRRLGYATDHAVVNEALPTSPQIAATSYGMGATEDALQPSVRGQFVLGSARWWTREQAGDRYAMALKRAQQLSDVAERRQLLHALLRIDPSDAVVSGMLGDLEFEAFLEEGLAKGGITATDKETKLRAGELYWNFVAQSWRQELTEVAQGHSAAAEALYGAMRGIEAAEAAGQSTPLRRNRLGMLYRWNNNVEEALKLHETLLEQTPAQDGAARARLLSEVAWDRIQWVNWNRRYDHPWLVQAQGEAQQALDGATAPLDRLMAAEVLLVAEALSFDRTKSTMEARVQAVKQSHDRLTNVSGLWPHLIGNDMVKSLIPESRHVALPAPIRSEEVANVGVHARVPRQDITREWEFDKDSSGAPPAGFTSVPASTNGSGPWRVQVSDAAVTTPNILTHDVSCQSETCISMLSGQPVDFAYPDATVQLMVTEQSADGGAGIAMWERGGPTAYAVVLNPAGKQVKFYRVRNGQVDLLATETVSLVGDSWHSLRVQRVNYAHVSRPRLAAYVDGHQVSITPDEVIPAIDRVGLIVRGRTAANFDSLHLIDMITNRPMSSPAAY